MANRRLNIRSVHVALDSARDEKDDVLSDAAYAAELRDQARDLDFFNEIDPRTFTEAGRREIAHELELQSEQAMGSWYDDDYDY